MRIESETRKSTSVVGRTKRALAYSSIALLTACGGGGGSSSEMSPIAPVAPTAATPQIAKGTVSGFGSVFINGVEWETDDCEFTIDDEPGDESQLEVGDIVEVEGTVDSSGVAQCTSMEYDSELEGLITEVGADYILVQGLRVMINGDTVFDSEFPNQDITDLTVGLYVEVSAFTTEQDYVATRIDLEVDDGEVEVYGKVANLDADLNTFTIFAMTVDYSAASFDDFDGKTLADGDYVEVEGDAFGADDELLATSVEYKDNNPFDDGDEGDEFEVEGYLAVIDGSPLTLNGFEIVLAANVDYERGSEDDLIDGAKVEVEGSINAAGQLVVDEVKFKVASDSEITASLDSLPMQDAASNEWTISLLDRSIKVTDQTQFEDNSDTDETYFDLADLVEGEWLEVKLFQDGQGELVALRIERENPQELVELEGTVSDLDDQTLTIAGFTVVLDDQTDLPVGSTLDDFVSSLEVGVSRVEVEGVWSEGQIVAYEIELED